MTNQPYLYDPRANVLRQRAEIKSPDVFSSNYGKEVAQYEQDIASIPAFTPVSGWVPEVGKEYVEGKDFEVKEYTAKFGFETYGSRVAVPIEQKQEEPTKEDVINLVDALRSISLYSSADHPESIRNSVGGIANKALEDFHSKFKNYTL